ncbi:MAG: carbohydrate-binding protein, partial [Fibrobacter sp.]|nr:carbohydrate-binding protein [Fibrobacter sp.]
AIKGWGFEGSGKTPPEPQKPFGDKAWVIPGKIQMEDFDVPGTGRGDEYASYSDNDAENHGDSDYRKDTGVDLYKKSGDRVVVGYIQKDEWLEYTVNVAEAGDYTLYAAVASDGGSSFSLSLDGNALVETIEVPKANKADGSEEQNFDDYSKVKANVTLPAGEHVLRMTATADWFDIDYINFVKGKDAEDAEPLPSDPSKEEGGSDAISGQKVAFGVPAMVSFDVFDLKGSKVASFKARTMAEASAQWMRSPTAKNQGVNLIRNTATGAVSYVRSVR